MANFTPGPWEVHETWEGHEIRMGTAIESPGLCEVQHSIEYSHDISRYRVGMDQTKAEQKQFEEAKANARLIAAAPDMYEALKYYAESKMYGPGYIGADVEVAKQALAKAKEGK